MNRWKASSPQHIATDNSGRVAGPDRRDRLPAAEMSPTYILGHWLAEAESRLGVAGQYLIENSGPKRRCCLGLYPVLVVRATHLYTDASHVLAERRGRLCPTWVFHATHLYTGASLHGDYF